VPNFLQLIRLSLLTSPSPPPVPPKLRGRKRNRNPPAPLSGLDVSALLSASRPTKAITPENPVPEFRQLLDATEDPTGIHTAAKQFSAIIEKHIAESFGDSNYGRVVEEMRVLREEMVDVEEVGVWNGWIRGLKDRLLKGELGMGREELWWRVRREGLGLVGKGESGVSEVSEEEAKQFLASK